MSNPSGLWIDLKGLEFAESGMPTRLHAMPSNKSYMHPRYGKIDFTPDRIGRFADNVNNRVRGIDLDIDYDHKMNTTKAAGWVTAAEATADGLMLDVDFTEPAKEAIRAGEYRYFSPEFADRWKDPASGTVHKDVLFGGGITNRPFLKDLRPYALVEGIYGAEAPEGDPMTDPVPAPGRWERVLGWLGISENPSDADIEKAFRERVQPPNDPRIAAMEEQLKAAQTALAAQAVALREASVRGLITQLTEGSGYALPIPAVEKLSEFLMDCTDEQQAKLVEVFTEIKDKGLVPLRELGENTQTAAEPGNVVDLFERKIEEYRKTNSDATYAEAASAVASQLGDGAYRQYRSASFLKDGVTG